MGFPLSRRLVVAVAVFLVLVRAAPAPAAEFGFSGMHVQGVNQAIATALGLAKAEGVMVMDVALGGPADAAGVQRGDRVTVFDGTAIDTFNRLVKVVTQTKPGQTVDLTVQRADGEHAMKMTLGVKSPAWKVSKGAVINFSTIGITLASITEKIRQRFKIRWGSVGVLVTLIDPAFADRMLLKRGDVIVQVNQHDVWEPAQVQDAYDKAKAAKIPQLLMLIERADGFSFMMLPVK